jgi:hypothetical protein
MAINEFTETQIKRLLPPQVEYIYDGAFDSIIKVRILDDGLVIVLNLNILPFPAVINVPEDMVPAQGNCFFRATGTTSSIIINALDVPADPAKSYLSALFANLFCRAQVDSPANIDALQAADRFASDGIKVMRVDNVAIDTIQGCIDLANALKDEFEKRPITVGPLRTLKSGLASGQKITYTSERDGQIFELTITDVKTLILGGVFQYDIMLMFVVAKTPEQRKREILRRFNVPLVERKTVIDIGFVG